MSAVVFAAVGIRKAAAGLPREVRALIVPEKTKLAGDNMQRIALEPERIDFVGPAAW